MLLLQKSRPLAQIIHGFLGLSTVVWAGDIQSYLQSFNGSAQQWYPTSFTRDIEPVFTVPPKKLYREESGIC